MALAIATNNAASFAAASASSVNRDMDTSMARLSTGLRINSARDDAAGVAIASRLSSEIRGTDQSIRNALDGQALIDTAEGGHKEIENILQRLREISVQSANDTNDRDDRLNLQAEMNALITEIDRIASVTTWAGQSMFAGGSQSNKTDFSFQVGTRTGAKNQIGITLSAMSASALGLKVSPSGSSSTAPGAISAVVPQTSGLIAASGAVTLVVPKTSGGTPGTPSPADLFQGRIGQGTATSSAGSVGVVEINNKISTPVQMTFVEDTAGAATPPISVDLSTAAGINAAVIAINTAWNISQGSTAAPVSIATVGALGGNNADTDDGKLVLDMTVANINRVGFAKDLVNTTASATMASSGVVTFNAPATTTQISFLGTVGSSLTSYNYTITKGSPGTAVAAINAQNTATGLYASIEAAGSPSAGKLKIQSGMIINATTSVAAAGTGSDPVDISLSRGGSAATLDAAFNNHSERTGNTISGYLNHAAPAVGADSTLATADLTKSGSVLTAVTGKTSATIDMNGTFVTVSSLNGGAISANKNADATAIATAINLQTGTTTAGGSIASTHTYIAVASTDGTGNVTITPQTLVAATDDVTKSGSVLTAAAGKTSATIDMNGTFVTVPSLNGGATSANKNADATAIATAINLQTGVDSAGAASTHTYTALASTDGTGNVTITKGVVGTSVANASNARDAIDVIDQGIKDVNTQRSELGAISNRLSHTVNNLTNISSNLSAAKGGIEDADFAFETTNLAKNQILQQASTAMLAQANASKQNMLSLLQG